MIEIVDESEMVTLAVLDAVGDKPEVTDAVGVMEGVVLSEIVPDGVTDGGGVELKDAADVTDFDKEILFEAERVMEADGGGVGDGVVEGSTHRTPSHDVPGKQSNLGKPQLPAPSLINPGKQPLGDGLGDADSDRDAVTLMVRVNDADAVGDGNGSSHAVPFQTDPPSQDKPGKPQPDDVGIMPDG